jgi:hypothetical protein
MGMDLEEYAAESPLNLSDDQCSELDRRRYLLSAELSIIRFQKYVGLMYSTPSFSSILIQRLL